MKSVQYLQPALMASLVLWTGCGDDDGSSSTTMTMDGGSAPSPDTGPGASDMGPGMPDMATGAPEAQPLFAAGIRLRLPDGTTTSSFLRTFDSLDGVDLIAVDDEAREFTGQRRFRKVPGGMLLESADNPTITRFDFVEGEGLVEGDTISFLNQGFGAAGLTIVVGENKAYNIDFASLRVAIFDPRSMLLTQPDTIALPSDELSQGFATNGIQAAQVDDLLYVAVAFANLTDVTSAAIDPGITVYILDTSTDTLVDTIVDDRCSHANGTIQTEDGDVYILGDNGFNVIVPAQACIVRILAGETEFDASYLFQPAAELGGRQASDLVALQGNLAITFPLYPERLDPDNPISIAFDPVRKPWLLDLVNQTATEFVVDPPVAPEDDPLFTRGAVSYRIGGEVYLGIAQSFEDTFVFGLDPETAIATELFASESQLISLLEFP
ncbi:MAG: hypothetical protein ACFB9M_14700 [Myxococcota bacterium]